jgi:transposase InsO family protein
VNRRTFIGSLGSLLVFHKFLPWGKKAAEPTYEWVVTDEEPTGQAYISEYVNTRPHGFLGYRIPQDLLDDMVDLDADSKRAVYGNLWDLYG